MRLLLDAVLVPHAPVLLPEVNGAGGDDIRRALRSLDPATPEGTGASVWVSPHGARDLVYDKGTGDLGAFGAPGVEVDVSIDRTTAGRIAALWGRPLESAPLDHGLVVPLAAIGVPGPVVVLALSERSFDIDPIKQLAGAVKTVAEETNVSLVASAHGAASLSARAPLTDRPEGHELQDAIDDAFATDLARLVDIPDRLWDVGGSCSRSVLTLLGLLCGGRRIEVLASAQPFGVGYRVGRTV